jgi:hypothetical protein
MTEVIVENLEDQVKRLQAELNARDDDFKAMKLITDKLKEKQNREEVEIREKNKKRVELVEKNKKEAEELKNKQAVWDNSGWWNRHMSWRPGTPDEEINAYYRMRERVSDEWSNQKFNDSRYVLK